MFDFFITISIGAFAIILCGVAIVVCVNVYRMIKEISAH